MAEPGENFDWSLTTWEGNRRAQIRAALQWTLRERLEAVEGLADVMRRFGQMRARGEFTSASGDHAVSKTAPQLHESSPPYETDK